MVGFNAGTESRWKYMSKKELGMHIKEIKHTMDCEGLPLTTQNEKDIADILRGARTGKEIKAAVMERNRLKL